MTISDLLCDACESFVPGLTNGPETDGGVRFVYHPGRPQLRDTSGLLCARCWGEVQQRFGETRHPRQCSVCGQAVARHTSLHVHRFEDARAWRLCAQHAVEFLNDLRTVQPKLDPATFRFPFADDPVEEEPASS
jgi:hypothetical protein